MTPFSENDIPIIGQAEQQEVVDQKKAQMENYAMIETHLQVSNLVKILFTIDFNTLRFIVNSTPEDLRGTKHFKVLDATLNYMATVAEAHKTE